MAKLQKSVVLLKPDALQRGLVGEIITRFEKKGLKLMGLKMMNLTDELLDDWYAHHKEKPFFGDLKKFMMSAPIIAMLWEGLEAVSTVRKLCGVTKGYEAEGGSIRGDFSISGQLNIIHASDSIETALKEEGLIFDKDEVFDYDKGEYLWVYSVEERD
ncbi:nucleoside-diphosphate kinase [Candidatus Beckwithbacteria bacterium CG10_big_fil_rev_8_21_14_0_10_34_10]|uniref:Nucleoside diphosphate kinase n=1 Tax=Candidatus Beckwithbacteria bacterium CG10_big_fil_rev_8_21_14_0_10_34_10 TaxID=1974495 RepID=A0A2H0W8R7_9BACT|nr:MAG: nucleoside-diphosphate kinase [Candidatus Beckwithbacteria bacterium CG10_big_fil_rev_8_21_14_0_10_34_10]